MLEELLNSIKNKRYYQKDFLSKFYSLDLPKFIFKKVNDKYILTSDAYLYITKILGIKLNKNWMLPMTKKGLMRKLKFAKRFKRILPVISKALKRKQLYYIYNNIIYVSKLVSFEKFKEIVEDITKKQYNSYFYVNRENSRNYYINRRIRFTDYDYEVDCEDFRGSVDIFKDDGDDLWVTDKDILKAVR